MTTDGQSQSRTLEFNDSAAEMFSFDVNVTAYERVAGGGVGGGTTSSSGTTSAGSGTSGTGLQLLPKLMRITVNPLTKTSCG